MAILSQRSGTSSPDLSQQSFRTESDELVMNDELEVFEISVKEVHDESAFPEASEQEPEPPAAVDCPVEVVPEPINDNWGVSTPVKPVRKTKKVKRALQRDEPT